MFAQSFGRQDNFDHYAPDELAVLREEKLNELQSAKWLAFSEYPYSDPIDALRPVQDVEHELALIDEELNSRSRQTILFGSRAIRNR